MMAHDVCSVWFNLLVWMDESGAGLRRWFSLCVIITTYTYSTESGEASKHSGYLAVYVCMYPWLFLRLRFLNTRQIFDEIVYGG